MTLQQQQLVGRRPRRRRRPRTTAVIVVLALLWVVTTIGAQQQQQQQQQQSNNNRYNGRATIERRRELYRKALKDHYYHDDEDDDPQQRSPHNHKHNNATHNFEQAYQAYVVKHSEITRRTSYPNHWPDRSHSLHHAFPPFPPSRKQHNKALLQHMFYHAYDNYMYHAFPAGELHPLSCQPATFDLIRIDALTLMDSLDVLVLFHNWTEVARSVERLRHLQSSAASIFQVDQNVSVFETNIRVLGGLLSAHQLIDAYMKDHDVLVDQVWDRQGKVQWGYPPVENSDDDDEDALLRTTRWDYSTWISDSTSSTTTTLLDHFHRDVCRPTTKMEPTTTVWETCSSGSGSSNHNNATRIYKYDGLLLEMAKDIGTRLLPAFATRTGIPYGTVNLLYGVPVGETPIASLAGSGTLTLEFELLSRLTGDPSFGKAAKLASRALFLHKSSIDLYGKHIDVQGGHWTENLSGIGSNSDSFFEYLVKHYVLFPDDDDFWPMFQSAYTGVYNHSRAGEWYVDVDRNVGMHRGHSRRQLESLMAFYPGMQVLLGEVVPAARSLNSFFMVRESLGFLPERFNFITWKVDAGRGAGKYPLRPELLESCYFAHRAFQGLSVGSGVDDNNKDPVQVDTSGWLWAADFALHALHDVTRTECGYASVQSVSPETTGSVDGATPLQAGSSSRLVDEMPSFFLSETIKYLYLTFDDDNILHNDDDRDWVFTTEAHPIHSVDPVNRDRLLKDVKALDELLTSRNFRKPPKNNVNKLKSGGLAKEKWSSASSIDSYRSMLRSVEDDIAVQRRQMALLNRTDFFFDQRQLLSKYFVDDLDPGERDTIVTDENNLAHLSLGHLGLGPGSLLRKACPNVHSTDLLWIHALAGATDYSPVYVSAAQDPLAEHPNQFFALGAAESLGLLGTGVYMGLERDSSVCPVAKANVADRQTPEMQVGEDHEQIYHVQSDMGNFDVSPFSNGEGFHFRHVETGETLLVSFLPGAQGDRELIMAYLTMPTDDIKVDVDGQHTEGSPWRQIGSRLSSLFSNSKTKFEEEFVSSHRTVVLADFAGNAFSCEVQVVEKFVVHDPDSDDGVTQDEAILAVYPCGLALFGPTQLSVLLQTGGVDLEMEGVAPIAGDEYGCRHGIDTDETDIASEPDAEPTPRSNICQIVHRGQCSFYSKAVNQMTQSDASAVIIINDDETELFALSYGEAGEFVFEQHKLPATVLLAGYDGDDLLEKLAVDADDNDAEVVVRVSVSQRLSSRNKVSNDWPYFPVVRGSPELLEVYCHNGWGIHASRQEGTGWHIQFVRHELGNEE